MDISSILKKASNVILKYKYPLLVLLAGILLMCMPARSEDPEPPQITVQPQQTYPSVEAQLAQILGKVKGAGDVQVMLTTRVGEQTIYQTDTSSSGSESSNTVIISDSNRVQSGLVRQVHGPIYQGAIILCRGASDPNVRLAIIDAVSKVTGLGSDRISVLELK